MALAAQRPNEPPLSSAAYPLAGLYDSADPLVAGWHVKLANGDIDAFAFYGVFSNFRAHRYENWAGRFRYMTQLIHQAGKKMLPPLILRLKMKQAPEQSLEQHKNLKYNRVLIPVRPN